MQFFTGLRFEVEQASRGLSAIAELLVYFYILSFDVIKDNNNKQGSEVTCSMYYMNL